MHIIALNRHWIIAWRWLFACLAAVALLLALALWQWQRAMVKTELLQRLEQAQPISVQQLAGVSAMAADGMQINAQARWLAPALWLLDNQLWQGRPGYDVVVPVQLDSSTTLILVNLGWVAAPLQRTELPEVSVPVSFPVKGVLRTQGGGLLLGKNVEDKGRWPMRVQQLNTLDLGATLAQPLYPGVIYLQQNSPYKVHYQAVVLSPERHRAYALQWALLAVAVTAVALATSLQRDLTLEDSSDADRQ